MRRMRGPLTVVGLILIVFGALFALQGADVIRWPAESFMIGARTWVVYGALLAFGGAVLMLSARLIR